MKKRQIQGIVVIVTLLAAYCAVAFLIPFERDNAVFWVSFVFTLVALAAQVYVVYTAFGGDQDAKSRFYGFPIARVGFVYLIAQVVLSIVFMALAGNVRLWLPLLLYIVLAGTAALGFIATDVTRDEIQRQDADLKANVSAMRSIQSKASALLGVTQDAETRKAVEKLSDALRYSDPVSSPAISEIESDLAACVDELQKAVVDGDKASALALAEKAGNILIERNRQCKLNK